MLLGGTARVGEGPVTAEARHGASVQQPVSGPDLLGVGAPERARLDERAVDEVAVDDGHGAVAQVDAKADLATGRAGLADVPPTGVGRARLLPTRVLWTRVLGSGGGLRRLLVGILGRPGSLPPGRCRSPPRPSQRASAVPPPAGALVRLGRAGARGDGRGGPWSGLVGAVFSLMVRFPSPVPAVSVVVDPPVVDPMQGQRASTAQPSPSR